MNQARELSPLKPGAPPPTNPATAPPPVLMRQRLHVGIVVGITALIGTALLVQPQIRRFPAAIQGALLPFHLRGLPAPWHLLLGFTMLYASYQLWQRKVAAWWLALGSYLFIFGAALVSYRTVIFSLLAVVCVGLLAAGRPFFRRRFEVSSLRRGVIGLCAALVISVAYGVLGFWLLDRRDYGVDFNLKESVERTFQEFTVSGNDDLRPRTRYAARFLDSIDIIGVVGLAYGLTSLFQPLSFRLRVLPREREMVRQLLVRYGARSEGQLKLWPEDKQYYFSPSEHSVVAYKVARGVALAAGDPVGDPAERLDTVRRFQEYCHGNGWQTVFMLADEELLELYRQAGFREVKMGDDAIVALPHFAGSVATDKHFRNIFNRFGKQGFGFARQAPPHPPELMAELQAVSDRWLELPGRREWGFLQGYFDPEYLQQNGVFTLRDAGGRLVAFANQVDPYVAGQATIDLMRHRPEAPTGTMDFLLGSILLHLHAAGYQSFNLGQAPLTGLREQPNPGVEEAVLEQLAALADRRIMAVEGLRQFKSKFKPEWHGRYVVYEGLPHNLVRVALALTRAMQR